MPPLFRSGHRAILGQCKLMPGGSNPIAKFDDIISLVEQHHTYSLLVHEALIEDDPLILNYHSHSPGEPYCVSLCKEVIDITHQGDHLQLVELAHIKEVGSDEASCYPLMSVFAQRLRKYYHLDYLPEIYLNGLPFNLPPSAVS